MNVKLDIHEAFFIENTDNVYYGSVFGMVSDGEVGEDIVTNIVKSYTRDENGDLIVTTRSNSNYRIVSPDEEFLKSLDKVIAYYADR